MPSDTFHDIPYPVAADPVADGENTIQALAERVDLMLGETGTLNVTGIAVDTIKSVRVDYARSYAALAPMVPKAFAFNDQNTASTTTCNVWTSGEDATGFTVNLRVGSTSNRVIKWLCRGG